MKFGDRLGLEVWQRKVRGQGSGMSSGFRVDSWVTGVCPSFSLLQSSQTLDPILFLSPGHPSFLIDYASLETQFC